MSEFWTGLILGLLLAIVPAAVILILQVRRACSLIERAKQAERLSHLGMLTGGLAHEIKNPLSTLGLNIQLLQEDLNEILRAAPPGSLPEDRTSRLQRRFDALARETQRLRHILDDFLRFAGRLKLDRVPTDINALVSELADFFTPQAQAAQIRLRLQLAPGSTGTLQAHVDPDMLKQALLNLLLNATHAMQDAVEKQQPHGGAMDLIIKTERPRTPGRKQVSIHVIDTGPGIAADKLDKIFQPYFSTKKQGTGLGLPTSRRIIEEHGGTITVHSDVGRGTDFVVTLPTDVPAAVPVETD